MPLLSDTIHLDMLRASHRNEEPRKLGIYGLQWGDPEVSGPLKFIRDRYIRPYIDFDHTAVEIGPGGGRWTRYLLSFRSLYAVDYHQELLDELQQNFKTPNLRIIKNSGTNFPDVPDNSVDFVFSFGVFVHLELDIIRAYLQSLYTIVTNTANIVIQYSDKTKEPAKRNPGFGHNNPNDMRQLVAQTGYTIREENVTALPHSAIVRFTKGRL